MMKVISVGDTVQRRSWPAHTTLVVSEVLPTGVRGQLYIKGIKHGSNRAYFSFRPNDTLPELQPFEKVAP